MIEAMERAYVEMQNAPDLPDVEIISRREYDWRSAHEGVGSTHYGYIMAHNPRLRLHYRRRARAYCRSRRNSP